jgi:hypothetical protein
MVDIFHAPPRRAPREPTHAELVPLAEQDEHTLALTVRFNRREAFADPDFYKHCLLRRQIRLFVQSSPQDYQRCLVCAGQEPGRWLMKHLPLDLAVHCGAHAEEFHAGLPLQPQCCVPLYHPLNDYPWRECAAELRTIEQAELRAEQQYMEARLAELRAQEQQQVRVVVAEQAARFIEQVHDEEILQQAEYDIITLDDSYP